MASSSGRKGKAIDRSSPWSEYDWDDRGFWFCSRYNENGDIEYKYQYAESTEPTPEERASTPRFNPNPTSVNLRYTSAATFPASPAGNQNPYAYPPDDNGWPTENQELYTTGPQDISTTQWQPSQAASSKNFPGASGNSAAGSPLTTDSPTGPNAYVPAARGNSGATVNEITQGLYGASITDGAAEGMTCCLVSKKETPGGLTHIIVALKNVRHFSRQQGNEKLDPRKD